MEDDRIRKLISRRELPLSLEDNQEILSRLSIVEPIIRKKRIVVFFIFWVLLQLFDIIRDLIINRPIYVAIILLIFGGIVFYYAYRYKRTLIIYLDDLRSQEFQS